LPGDSLFVPPAGYENVLKATVERWVGTPYLWGGLGNPGIDCSGFSRQVYRDAFRIELPRNSREQATVGSTVDKRQLVPGDLVFFDTLDRGHITHVGVYLGGGVFAHASSSQGVTRAEIDKTYYVRAYWGGRRVLRL
jgi:probable lipoprotein NlpC